MRQNIIPHTLPSWQRDRQRHTQRGGKEKDALMAESEVPEWMDGWEWACLVLDWRPSTASLRFTDTYSVPGTSSTFSRSKKDVRGTTQQGRRAAVRSLTTPRLSLRVFSSFLVFSLASGEPIE